MDDPITLAEKLAEKMMREDEEEKRRQEDEAWEARREASRRRMAEKDRIRREQQQKQQQEQQQAASVNTTKAETEEEPPPEQEATTPTESAESTPDRDSVSDATGTDRITSSDIVDDLASLNLNVTRERVPSTAKKPNIKGMRPKSQMRPAAPKQNSDNR